MHRFYVAPENFDPNDLRLRGSEAHHARNVLRLEPNTRVVVFDGAGREITAEITALHRDQVPLRALHEAKTPPLCCHITLAQAIPKGKNMDLIVQKAVEIGASEIAPIISERTIVHLSLEEAEEKRAKWQQIAIEAAKQCGQNWLPRVHRPCKLKDFFADAAATVYDRRAEGNFGAHRTPLHLIGSLQSDAQHLKQILRNYQEEHANLPDAVLLCIGPEGDFTPAELSLARGQGCQPLTLGPIILRVETAAIYALSILSYELLVAHD